MTDTRTASRAFAAASASKCEASISRRSLPKTSSSHAASKPPASSTLLNPVVLPALCNVSETRPRVLSVPVPNTGARRQLALRKGRASRDELLSARLLQSRKRDGDIRIGRDCLLDKRNQLRIPEGTPPLREIDACHQLGSGSRSRAVQLGYVASRKPRFGKREVRAHGASRQTCGAPAGNPTSKYSLERSELLLPQPLLTALKQLLSPV